MSVSPVEPGASLAELPPSSSSTSVGGEAHHSVHFYESDLLLCDAVADFLRLALQSGDAILVVASAAHRAAFMDRLRTRGVEVERASEKGLITLLDAGDLLDEIMTGIGPAAEKFERLFGPLLESAGARAPSRRVSVYAEVVDVLWKRGDHEAALRLEDFWNDLSRQHAFSLFCGYVIHNAFNQVQIRQICAKHSHVRKPDQRHAELATIVDPDSITVDQARTLIGELSEKKRADRRAERLLRVTAAIADAVTPDQVFEAIVDHVATALDAASAGLWLLHENGKHVGLVRAFGYSEEAKSRFDAAELDGPDHFPALDTLRTGEPIWFSSQAELLERYPNLIGETASGKSYVVACLPLIVENRAVGTLGFTFAQSGSIDRAERSFLLLVARYSSQAIERLRLLDAERRSRARAEAFAARMQLLSRENEAARDRAELLYALARAVLNAERAEEIFAATLDAIQLALGTSRSAVMLFDSGGVMRFKAWRGLSDQYRNQTERRFAPAHDERAPEPIWVTDVGKEASLAAYRELLQREAIGAIGFIPLVAGGRLLGRFVVYYETPREFGRVEIDLANAIANHVAAAVARLEALNALQRSVRFNEMFTAVLGHDLRNPLGAIMAAAQLANKRPKAQALAKPLARILKSGERMARMIDQLLDFTRVRVGEGIPLHPKPLDMLDVIRHVVAELEVAHPDWKVRIDCRADTSGSWDEDRLLQVFSNLLANAVQHGMIDGGVQIELDGSAPDCVEISIHNTGAIPAELLPRLFDPMTAGERQRDKSQGLGLGLFISQQIVGAHAGSITVKSSSAHGTTFTVSLPRQPGDRE